MLGWVVVVGLGAPVVTGPVVCVARGLVVPLLDGCVVDGCVVDGSPRCTAVVAARSAAVGASRPASVDLVPPPPPAQAASPISSAETLTTKDVRSAARLPVGLCTRAPSSGSYRQSRALT